MSEEREEYKSISTGETFYAGGKLVQFSEVVQTETFEWRVIKPDDLKDEIVTAARCYIDEGCLVFEDEEGMITAAFAPGRWFEVSLEEE